MVELIDMVMNKLYPSVEYKVEYVLGNNLKYKYHVVINNGHVFYDSTNFEPIFKCMKSDKMVVFKFSKLERDLRYFANVDVIVRNYI